MDAASALPPPHFIPASLPPPACSPLQAHVLTHPSHLAMQTAVALGMAPHVVPVLEAARQPSFLARLSLLDPRTMDPATLQTVRSMLPVKEEAVGPTGVAEAEEKREGAGEGEGEGDPAPGPGPGPGPGEGPALLALFHLLTQLVWVPKVRALAFNFTPSPSPLPRTHARQSSAPSQGCGFASTTVC